MKKIQIKEGLGEQPLVEDHFDIIAGAGTGAIIATLVGRLGMTTKQAVATFARLSNEGFSYEKLVAAQTFKASKLEKIVKDIVRERTGNEDEPMLYQDTNSRRCRVMVFAASKHNMKSGTRTIIRSYHTSANPAPNCTIWQALLAATALPGTFELTKIAGQGDFYSFVDLAMGCGNLIKHVVAEVKRIYPNRRVTAITSIDTGPPCTIRISEPSPLQRIFPTELIAATKDTTTDDQRAAQDMNMRPRGARDVYFRLNMDEGMRGVRLSDRDQLGEVQAHTRVHMKKAETKKLVRRAVDATRERRSAIPMEHFVSSWSAIPKAKYLPDGELHISAVRQGLGVKTCPVPASIYTDRPKPVQLAINYLTGNAEERRVFVFHGLGGSGKTQLALRTVERTRDHWSDVIYVDATSIETLMSTLRQFAVARGLGYTHEATLLWLSFRTERWLLVFDNADDTSLNLESYFPNGRHGRVLITTRNQDIAVLADGPGSAYNVSSMEPEESLQLLLTVAGVNIRTLADGENNTVNTIVQDLGHLALAVAHAGAYIRRTSCSFGRYQQLYKAKLQQIYNGLPFEDEEFKKTVHATWKRSYDVLSESAQKLLWLLAYLQRDRITVDIFLRAAARMETFRLTSPLNRDDRSALDKTKSCLSNFLDSAGVWDGLVFSSTMREIMSCSLISFGRTNETYELHPLVQYWIRTVIPCSPEMALAQSTFLIALSIDEGKETRDYAFRRSLVLHVNSLMERQERIDLASAACFGIVLNEAGQYGRAELLWPRVMEGKKEALGDEHPETLSAMNDLANTYWSRGRYKQAETLQVQVLEKHKRVFGDGDPTTLIVMGNLASTYSYRGLYKEAETLRLQALEGLKRAPGGKHIDTLYALGDLALTHWDQGLYYQAETLQVQVLEGCRRVLGVEHPDVLTATNDLATTYRKQGRYTQAETLQTQVLERRRQTLGDEHPDTLTAMDGLALTYSDQGLYQQAETLQAQVLEGRKRALGDEHPETISALSNLANTYSHQGLYRQAETLQVQVLEGYQRAHGGEHPNILTAMGNLAATYSDQGLHKQAEALQVQVLKGCGRVLGNEHPDTLSAMNNLATIYLDQALFRKAETLQAQVVEGRKQCLGELHPDTLTAMSNLAVTYSELGQLTALVK
ncbi:hypothetical protein FRC09_000370, partial [Ceratobasidium sp. 395]